MQYCHDCSEFSLKYQLALSGNTHEVISDKDKSLFTLEHKSKICTISIKEMFIDYDGTKATCKDWKIFVNKLLEVLNS